MVQRVSRVTKSRGRRLATPGLRPERNLIQRMTPVLGLPRVLQRRGVIFFALALEFFLRGFEVCDARGDFCPLASEAGLSLDQPLLKLLGVYLQAGGVRQNEADIIWFSLRDDELEGAVMALCRQLGLYERDSRRPISS